VTDVSVSSEQGTFYIHDDPVVQADRGNRFTEAIHHHTMRIDGGISPLRRFRGIAVCRGGWINGLLQAETGDNVG